MTQKSFWMVVEIDMYTCWLVLQERGIWFSCVLLSCLTITSRISGRGYRIGAVCEWVYVWVCVWALSRPNHLTYDLWPLAPNCLDTDLSQVKIGFKSNFPTNFLRCYKVCVCVCVNPSWQKDFRAKGLYMRGMREVCERSGIFMLIVWLVFDLKCNELKAW